MQTFKRLPFGLRVLIITLLSLGIFFRFANLDLKIYWHDEVYTQIRATGYTRHEIDQTLFENRFVTIEELQKFQQIKPGSTFQDTLNSLITEDPQHPPLYFFLARGWMQLFGDSITVSRILPALISLLGLPFMYLLARELFTSPLAAWLATVFLALSPFDVLFAQTARQYSLLTVVAIASSYYLLRSLRQPRIINWGFYAVSCAIGLYTHPFFGLTLIAQGVFAAILCWNSATPRKFKTEFFQFCLAFLVSIFLYLPWLWVLIANLQRANDTTNWTRVRVGIDYLLKLWTLSFSSLFLDLDFGFDQPMTYVVRSLVLIIIGFFLYLVYKQTSKQTKLFVFTSIFIPFLMLAIPDLVFGGKRSAVSRYLISCYPGIQLAVAYGLAVKLEQGNAFWRWILAVLVTFSISSCVVSSFADTWWSKDLSYFNAEVAKQINSNPQSIILSDSGDDFTNMGDILSLSYELNPQIRFFLISSPPGVDSLARDSEYLVFRTSGVLRERLEKEGKFEGLYLPGRLETFTFSQSP